MVKIAVIVLGDITKNIGGISTYQNQFMRFADKNGIELHYYMGCEYAETRKKESITLHAVDIKSAYEFYEGRFMTWNPLSYIRLYHYFQKCFREENYDLIQISLPDFFCVSALAAAKRLGIPVIGSYHNTVPECIESWFKKRMKCGRIIAETFGKIAQWWTRQIYSSCEGIIVPTKALREKLHVRGYDCRKVFVVGRGVEVDLFRPLPKGRKVKALFVGRLSPEKDLEYLDFFKGLGVELVIVGDGPMRASLEKRLPFAHFLGWKRGEELYNIYGESDFFVFPGISETFGNSILEALSAGLPVVAFEQGNYHDRITHGENGFLAREEREFKQFVSLLSENHKERARMSAQARKNAQVFSWSRIFEEQFAVYEQVLGVKLRQIEVGKKGCTMTDIADATEKHMEEKNNLSFN